MTIDLKLAFKKKPERLDEAMKRLGFTLERVVEPGPAFPVKMITYHFYDPCKSCKGVWFTYHDGVYSDSVECWTGVIKNPERIVSSGSFRTYMGRNGFDEKKQLELAKVLSRNFKTVLYDPQTGKIIK
jgi:hypothetical protein